MGVDTEASDECFRRVAPHKQLNCLEKEGKRDSAEVKFATEAIGRKNKLNNSFPIAT